MTPNMLTKKIAVPHNVWVSARELEQEFTSTPSAWHIGMMKGRLVEVSGEASGAVLSVSCGLIYQAQLAGELVAWITTNEYSFYPPDVIEIGIDLDALVVLRLPAPHFVLKAADSLLRSGGFGLIIVDLQNYDAPIATLARLQGLVTKFGATVAFLTRKTSEQSSLGSVISLRSHIQRIRNPDSWAWQAEILKDKRGAAGRRHQELCYGPAGLR